METHTEHVIRAMLAMQRYPWEQGVCAQALYEAGREELWIPMAYDAIQRQGADGRLAMIGGEPAVSDPAANGEVCGCPDFVSPGTSAEAQAAYVMADWRKRLGLS